MTANPELDAEYIAACERLYRARAAMKEAREEFAAADKECKRLEREMGI